ncbi:Predicted arabinose efflux permease, MFS family [Alkalispirochaeta americana]|uniref:Predicted arabinose efflux permease, MFS family n=1 Tax=Alkalispirochaeta americana TaxID=159291 RepID=A0A1N6SJ92_9SPIO|nr:MFS transporter [Alkalispirochaeta americana]SIQ41087.1 Predicted arabinose efflux permease, MFS family [Alkalispirochaeta americana]
MFKYYLFLRAYPAHVGFGFALTFFSSLGQTFLISLYVPHILADLGISNSAFGGMYAIATIGSALLLIQFGGLIDRRPLPGYVLKTIAILGAASILLGLTRHALILPFALLGLRFGGQGLMSHISQTTLGRFFQEDRGKALSLASLGFPAGEMVFPLVVALLIPLVGWRVSLAVNAAVLLGVLVPALYLFPLDDFDQAKGETASTSLLGISRREILKDPNFRRIAPSAIFLSFSNTAVFFYQLVLAESRGWPVAWYSAVFAGYAAARFAFGLLGGILVDRFSARRLYAVHFLPMILGLLVLAVSPDRWVAVVFLCCAGISLGLHSPIKAAVMAEVHGTANLGAIRSVYTSFLVGGTALGPMVFGLLLDQGIPFGAILTGTALTLGLTVLPSVALAFPAWERGPLCSARTGR